MSTMSAINWGGNTVVYAISSTGAVYQCINSGVMGEVDEAGSASQISVGLDRSGMPAYYFITPENQLEFEDLLDDAHLGLGIVAGYATAISATENNTLFYVGPGGSVYEVVGAAEPASRSFFSLGGYVTQISAGLDAAGHAEVFGIGGDGSVYVDDNQHGWVDLDFPATAISAAPTGNTVYAIGPQNTVYVDTGSGFTSLGGPPALTISATVTGSLDTVFTIGPQNAVYVNQSGGWGDLGGYATELSATSGLSVYFRGQDPGSINFYGIFGPRFLGNVGGAATSPIIGGNWSGYVAETNLTSPQLDSVTDVSASWVVPSVSPSAVNTLGSVWVGIGGLNNSPGVTPGEEAGLEQLGTAMDWTTGSRGGADYYAWWEMFPLPEQEIYGMTISPGDVITASVQYVTSGWFAGCFYLSITDDSRPNDSFATLQLASPSESAAAQRNSAEWIVENHGAGSPNFSPVSFADATATIDGVTGPINSPLWQSQAKHLNNSSLAPQSTTSMLTNQGNAFVETENTAPGAIGPNVMTAVPPSPTFNGPDITAPAMKKKASPRTAAAKVQDTGAGPDWRARRMAIAIDRPVAALFEILQDTAAVRTKALRLTRMGSKTAR